MKGKELSDELEHIVKYLCEVNNKQDTYALEIVDEVKKELEKLESYRGYDYIVGDFEKGDKQLRWEHIRIIVDDKTREIWQTSEEILDDKVITLNECLEIAKKELDYECGVMIIICESYLSGIIYRYGNYPNCNDFEIAGKMHGFA